jgi:RNA polymerase sigma-70 factor, ECF subfamily
MVQHEIKVDFLETEQLHDQHRPAEFELVRRVRSGDQEAFRDLVERHQARIFSVIYRILRNRQDAEDAAQQVFTNVYFALKDFDCRCPLVTWIYKIAINECYSHLRKQRAKLEHEADAPAFEAFAGRSRFSAGPQASNATTTAARDLLNKLLGRLAEEDRLLIVLKEVEGHSIGELAEMTGASESAIKTRLFRARQKLLEAAGRLLRRTVTPAAC